MTTTPSSPNAVPTPVARPYLGLLSLLLGGILLVLAAVFAFTYFEAQRAAQYTTAVNLAGRQRMLSQRITKSLYALQVAAEEGAATVLPQDEARRSAELFDQTLNAFSDGTQTRGTSQEMVQLPRIASTDGLRSIQRALAVWRPLSEKIKTLTGASGPVNAAQASAVAAYATDVNLTLLGLMDQLTTAVQNESAELGRRTTRIQLLAGGLTTLAIVGGIVVLIRRVRAVEQAVTEFTQRLQASNDELTQAGTRLAEAKQDTDLILTTVRQGMLLLDPKYRIGAQYSDELKRLFRIDDLQSMNFLSLLQRLLPEKMFNTTRDYLELMFDATKKEKQLAKINPLSQVEVNFPNPEGGFTTNFFEFSFRRIVQDKTVARLFVGVRDITPQVQLEQRLRSEEAKKERQFEILLSILHVDPAALGEFLQLARKELDHVNDAFKMEDLARAGGAASPVSDTALREKLKGVFASIHNVKGNAAVLKLEHFEKSAHEFEEEVRQLINRPRLAGEDLLTVVVRQSEFRGALDEAQELAGRIRGLARAPQVSGAPAAAPVDPIAEGVSSLVGATALKLGKKVRVDASGFSSADVPAEHRGIVKDLLIQLTRNAVVHGIEAPAQRVAAGKPAEAVIRLSGWMNGAASGGHAFHLHVQDDGQGLDYRRIKERAVALGLAKPAEVQALSDEESTGFIFASGFSTADATTTDAGRGAGLDFVKRRVIDDLGGEIDVACDPGKSLLFTIVLPAGQPAALTA